MKATHDAVSEFRAALNRAWTTASPKSAVQIEELSRTILKRCREENPLYHPLPDSTLHDNLKGVGKRLHRREFVHSLITVLREFMKAEGKDPDLIGTVENWDRRHRAAEAAIAGRPSEQELASGLFRAGWWHEYAELVPAWMRRYLDAEPSADQLRIYAPRTVPEVLQTPEYAAAVIAENLHGAPAEEIALRVAPRVALRMRRQEILREADPVLWVVLEEAAITRQVGSPEVMRGQYRHLLKTARSRRLTLLVRKTPSDVPILAEPLTLLRFGHTDRADLGLLLQADYGLHLDAPEDVAHFFAEFAALAKVADPSGPSSSGHARSAAESLEFIERRLDSE